jgi:hypothetical protein
VYERLSFVLMRVVLLLALALALVPAAASGAEVPADVEDCAPGAVQRVVGRFITAFNARNLPALDRVFSPAESFNWYSTGAPGVRLRAAAYDRTTLLPYFRARFRAGDRLRLVSFRSNGNSNGYGHFQFRLERRARTLKPTVYEGKGAAICAASGDTISVWSVGPKRG